MSETGGEEAAKTYETAGSDDEHGCYNRAESEWLGGIVRQVSAELAEDVKYILWQQFQKKVADQNAMACAVKEDTREQEVRCGGCRREVDIRRYICSDCLCSSLCDACNQRVEPFMWSDEVMVKQRQFDDDVEVESDPAKQVLDWEFASMPAQAYLNRNPPIAPGDAVRIRFRMVNTGNVPLEKNLHARMDRCEFLETQSATIDPLNPDEEGHMVAHLIAPSKPGEYLLRWRFYLMGAELRKRTLRYRLVVTDPEARRQQQGSAAQTPLSPGGPLSPPAPGGLLSPPAPTESQATGESASRISASSSQVSLSDSERDLEDFEVVYLSSTSEDNSSEDEGFQKVAKFGFTQKRPRSKDSPPPLEGDSPPPLEEDTPAIEDSPPPLEENPPPPGENPSPLGDNPPPLGGNFLLSLTADFMPMHFTACSTAADGSIVAMGEHILEVFHSQLPIYDEEEEESEGGESEEEESEGEDDEEFQSEDGAGDSGTDYENEDYQEEGEELTEEEELTDEEEGAELADEAEPADEEGAEPVDEEGAELADEEEPADEEGAELADEEEPADEEGAEPVDKEGVKSADRQAELQGVRVDPVDGEAAAHLEIQDPLDVAEQALTKVFQAGIGVTRNVYNYLLQQEEYQPPKNSYVPQPSQDSWKPRASEWTPPLTAAPRPSTPQASPQPSTPQASPRPGHASRRTEARQWTPAPNTYTPPSDKYRPVPDNSRTTAHLGTTANLRTTVNPGTTAHPGTTANLRTTANPGTTASPGTTRGHGTTRDPRTSSAQQRVPSTSGYIPATPSYTPGARSYTPGTLAYALASGNYTPGTPVYTPASGSYTPGTPNYTPATRSYTPATSNYTPKTNNNPTV